MITVHNAGWFDIICVSSHVNYDSAVRRDIINEFKLHVGQSHVFDREKQKLEIYANKLNTDLAVQRVLLKTISDVTKESYGIIAHGTAFNPWLEYNK